MISAPGRASRRTGSAKSSLDTYRELKANPGHKRSCLIKPHTHTADRQTHTHREGGRDTERDRQTHPHIHRYTETHTQMWGCGEE